MSEDKPFILKVSRDHNIFKNRAIKFGSYDKLGNYDEEIVSIIPDNLILCDLCNSKIETDEIMLLIPNSEVIWGAICLTCVEKYHKELEVKSI